LQGLKENLGFALEQHASHGQVDADHPAQLFSLKVYAWVGAKFDVAWSEYGVFSHGFTSFRWDGLERLGKIKKPPFCVLEVVLEP
jgi:hypothetical protein